MTPGRDDACMAIPPFHLRARRRIRLTVHAASGAYRWLDTPRGSTAVARLGVVALSALGAYVALRVYPDELSPPDRHADLLALVVQSRPIVFVGRVAILSTAAFAVLSVVARMWNRQWLAKAGPFEIERVMTKAEEENARLGEQLARASRDVRDLSTRLEDLERALVVKKGDPLSASTKGSDPCP